MRAQSEHLVWVFSRSFDSSAVTLLFIYASFWCWIRINGIYGKYTRTFHVAFHVRNRMKFTFCKQFMKFFSLEHRMIWYDGSYVIHLSCLQNVRGGGLGLHLHITYMNITKRASPFVSIMFCSDWTELNYLLC